MKVKTCPSAQIKAAGSHEGTDEGVFEAIVATYDVDSVGDRIIPGAFAKTLADWRTAGDPIPVIWSHESSDPEYHIGVVEDIEERAEGLWVKARVDMDEPKARKAYNLLKGRRVTQFSFSYDEIDARPAAKDGSGALKDLHQLRLFEIGPTLIGCNQRTSLGSVKSRPVLRKGHGMTAQELRRALDAAVTAAHGGPGRYIWVRDYTDDWVVFSAESDTMGGLDGGLQRQGYTVPDGQVTLTGQPYPVIERTDYVPVTGGKTAEPETKNSDAATPEGGGRVLSKETEDALHTALADLTVKLGQVGDLLVAGGGQAAEVTEASPPGPAGSPPEQATETAPASGGTASAHQPDVLMALALLEAEQGAYTI